jgi:hypothetical protein
MFGRPPAGCAGQPEAPVDPQPGRLEEEALVLGGAPFNPRLQDRAGQPGIRRGAPLGSNGWPGLVHLSGQPCSEATDASRRRAAGADSIPAAHELVAESMDKARNQEGCTLGSIGWPDPLQPAATQRAGDPVDRSRPKVSVVADVRAAKRSLRPRAPLPDITGTRSSPRLTQTKDRPTFRGIYLTLDA